MDAQEMSSQEKENLAGDVMESVGEPRESESEVVETHESEGHQGSTDPLYVQKRLKQQKRAHDREMRAMQARIEALQNQGQPHTNPGMDQTTNPYSLPENGGDMAEHIHKAVNQVLRHKEEEERRVKEAERMQHVQKQYHELNRHLDGMADRYDDFDDVVRGDAPFTEHMRDAALLLPTSGPGSAGETLYKLGKNRTELERIAKLHPLDQARELNKLSHALAKGEEAKGTNQPRPIGNIKSNPVNNSHAITEKTSPSEIRARMKAGKFK